MCVFFEPCIRWLNELLEVHGLKVWRVFCRLLRARRSSHRVQVPNISGAWSPNPWMAWSLEQESPNSGYLDPLGLAAVADTQFIGSKSELQYCSNARDTWTSVNLSGKPKRHGSCIRPFLGTINPIPFLESYVHPLYDPSIHTFGCSSHGYTTPKGLGAPSGRH